MIPFNVSWLTVVSRNNFIYDLIHGFNVNAKKPQHSFLIDVYVFESKSHTQMS